MKPITVVFFAKGHKNVLSTHKTTFEVTKETELSKRGNCIIAVESTMGAIDLPDEFKKAAQKENSKITITIEVGNQKETTIGKGNPKLQFTHPTDLVVRKSKFVCNRTLAIEANKASIDFSQKLVKKLQNPNQKVKFTLTVKNH
ncbi:MAG: DUF371 domain-containing protein [Candidatus Bathyarchaeota archaeon]